MTRSTPCATCPWRVGSDPSDIPGLSLEQAEGLRGCSGRTDGWYPVMACHGSSEGNDLACIGYLAADEALSNLRVRMLALGPDVDLGAIRHDCAEIDLFETWDEALEAMREQS